MAGRIRDDFEGGIWAHPQNEFGHVTGDPVWLVAGQQVPDDVSVSDYALHVEAETSEDSGQGGTSGADALPAPSPAAAPALDPQEQREMTVDEVNAWLRDQPDQVVDAVLEAEVEGRNRLGIVKGPHATRTKG